jgi:S-adenosylmethionine hydrolase
MFDINKISMKPLVLMSDFGLKEHFVACMKGVALNVHPEIKIFDLTHQIEPFNVWQAAITLADTISYWPDNTVFVSVIDPGVGTKRKSVVVKTKNQKLIVSPDNGVFTFVDEYFGIETIRLIDETAGRRPGSRNSHTFHGRDIYAYTGAKLAAGIISYEDTGSEIKNEIIRIEYKKPFKQGSRIEGTIMKIEEPYGNLATNIPRSMVEGIKKDIKSISSANVIINVNGKLKFKKTIPFTKSFGFVKHNYPLAYIDSSDRIGLALNQGNFSREFNIKAGKSSIITISLK